MTSSSASPSTRTQSPRALVKELKVSLEVERTFNRQLEKIITITTYPSLSFPPFAAIFCRKQKDFYASILLKLVSFAAETWSGVTQCSLTPRDSGPAKKTSSKLNLHCFDWDIEVGIDGKTSEFLRT